CSGRRCSPRHRRGDLGSAATRRAAATEAHRSVGRQGLAHGFTCIAASPP
ncbi:MAG: hypothetical protein AVDCRST_MAG08-2006, partial [uncultured Acetobacteraceae bacterium]